MTKPVPYAATRSLLLGAGLAMLVATHAAGQGTPEQQQACTPDALKLCSATIPDIPKTTACMKAHFAQLTPKCQAAFSDVSGAKTSVASERPKPHEPRVVRREERRTRHAAIEPAPRASTSVAPAEAPVVAAPPPVPVHHSLLPGLDSYRANIAQLCREGLVDSFTCRNTMSALDLAE